MRAAVVTAIWFSLVSVSVASDAVASVRKPISIAPQDLGSALQTLAFECDMKIMFVSDDVRDRRAAGVSGNLTPQEVLERLLSGTNLTYRFLDGQTISVLPVKGSGGIGDEPAARASEIRGNDGPQGRFRLAQVVQGTAASDASAQVSPRPEDTDRGALEEIVVTAQKRGEQRLIDTPISVGVLGGEVLEQGGLTDLSAILNSLGSVNLISYGAGQSTVAVRGVASESLFAGGTPTGYYLDEIALGFIESAIVPDTGSYDLERVEVLRGPQGTLYGVNSLNGVVRVISKDADLDTPEFKTRAIFSGTDRGRSNYGGDIAASVPLIPGKLAVRGVISHHEDGGWVDTEATTNRFDGVDATDINDGHSATYRLKINAAPSANLTLEAGAWLSRVRSQAPPSSQVDVTSVLGSRQPRNQDLDLFNLDVTYDFGSFTLLSATTYSEYDVDGEANLLLFNTLPIKITPNLNTASATSEEIRLNSKLDGPWQWSVGGFYRNLEEELLQTIPAFEATLHQVYEADEWAAFGELTRLLWDGKAELTAGARYYRQNLELREKSPLLQDRPLVNSDTDFDALSPRFVATYHPVKDLSWYVSVSKGFRAGQIQDPNSFFEDPSIGAIAKSDTLWNYELGLKGLTAGGVLSFEAAVYYMDWSNVQQRSVSAAATSYLRNAGSASGPGVDVTLSIRPAEGLAIGLGLGWNGLEIDDPVLAGSGVVLFDAGDRINFSSEYTAGLTADYTFPFGRGGLRGHLFGSVSGYSKMYRRQLNTAAQTVFVNESDAITNARLSFAVEAERWAVAVFLNNIGNEDGATLPTTSLGEATRLQPRTIGLQIDYRF